MLAKALPTRVSSLEEVDRILEEIREDGTFDIIYNKWFVSED